MDVTWTEIIIKTRVDNLERAEAALHAATPLGLYIEDYSDLETAVKMISGIDLIEEDLLEKDRGTALIHIYFSPEHNPAECAADVRKNMDRAGFSEEADGGGSGRNDGYTVMSVTGLAEDDWANNWKKYFKPLRIGKGILIRPEWEAIDRLDPEIMDGVNTIVSIDPGMAFGTGGHASTRMCLELVERFFTEPPGAAVPVDALDLGCGSGILSIASALMGARSALGVDIDKYAVRNAAENAKKNGVGDRVRFVAGDLLNGVDGRYRLIMANIVADIIIRLMQTSGEGNFDIKQYLHNNGVFIVSGIIDDREADVVSAAGKAGLYAADILRDGGWTAIALRRDNPLA